MVRHYSESVWDFLIRTTMSDTFGIFGGMGPLASAEFLKTIYELNLRGAEQFSPVCILHSDPTIPDRTTAILSGNELAVIDRLIEGVSRLESQGADLIVIACISSHYFLRYLPEELKGKVLSMLDWVVDEVRESKERCLLLSTSGTMKTGILQRHPGWPTNGKVVLPDEEDQEFIHNYIYSELKMNSGRNPIAFLERLSAKYGVSCFIAGCTEFHCMNKVLTGYVDCPFSFIDPLYSIAKALPQLLAEKLPLINEV